MRPEFFRIKSWKEASTINPHIQEQLELLQKAVDSITRSEEYRRYLRIIARFPTYSIRNTMLIYAQNPQATFVAGYKSWQTLFGRHVRKGEKGIRILAPCTFSSPKEQKEEQEEKKPLFSCTGFRTIYVFDISQTEGKELPSLPKPVLLEGPCSLMEQAVPILEKLCSFSVEFCFLPPDICGRCRYSTKSIQIHEELEEAHAFKTLIHECSHALLHNFKENSENSFERLLEQRPDLREIEAESVSFIVCAALGIDSSRYSFEYIAGWKKQTDFLEESLRRISRVSQQILQALSGQTS